MRESIFTKNMISALILAFSLALVLTFPTKNILKFKLRYMMFVVHKNTRKIKEFKVDMRKSIFD